MGAGGLKLRQWSERSQLLGLSTTVLLLLFLDPGSFVNGQATLSYDTNELASLQTIWGAWNKSTPDQSSNLAGWSSTQIYPCQYLNQSFNYTNGSDWRGVECMFWCDYNNDTYCQNQWNVQVAVISLANASIEGILPPDIANFSYMTNLELTGNPGLGGFLPSSLEQTWLNVLDLHDNGFIGPIPNLTTLWNLLKLDLGGNQFTGEYPIIQVQYMHALQELSIGNNLMGGPIDEDVYTNMTQLEKLDISDNSFTGPLPNLNPLSKLIYLDVSGNQFEGELPNLTQFPALQYVNLGRNQFKGTANLPEFFNLSANSSLTMVDMSYNQLTGPLPSWNASTLGSIQELYLDNNTLSGSLNIIQMYTLGLLQDKTSADNNTSSQKLRIMSLINNSITHVNHNPYVIANITTVFRLDGNPYCNNYDSKDDAQRCYCAAQVCFLTADKTNSNHRIITAAATSSVVAMVLIVLVVVGAILYKNRRYKQYLQLQFQQKFEEFDVKPTIFSYNELRAATQDFHEDTKLGQGSYGAVYKGLLPNGNVVAVKQLYIKSAQGLDEFLNEVVLITGMKHRNLVNLKGCCLRGHQRLLVYEYVEHFDVDQILLGPRREMVTWPVRLKICLGIARGLHYLHDLAQPRVIHRDIKAGNVLLDKNMEPKIADFGLALLFPDEQSHIMTIHIAGTKGYMAPEYASLGQLSNKVDVYSFGVLCLEIISGRHNIDTNRPLEQVYLSKWAWHLHMEDNLLELVDPTLHLTDDEVRDVERVINVCLLCTHNAMERRPSMARIVSVLQNDAESEVQVLSERRRSSYQSTRPQRSVDLRNAGSLGGISEESGTSHSRDQHSFAVELSEIRAR